MMSTVEILGIPGQQLPHKGGYALFAAAKQQVNVVAHEDPGVYSTAALTNVATEAIKKENFVLVILKNGRSVDPTHYNVVQGTRDV